MCNPLGWDTSVGSRCALGHEKLWEYEKYLIFFFMCLVGGMKKLEDEKFFCLVGEKKRRMENVIYINWLLYPYYIIGKK